MNQKTITIIQFIFYALFIVGFVLLLLKKPEPTPVYPDNSKIILELAQKIDSLARFRDTEKIIYETEKLVKVKNEITTANDSELVTIFWREYFGSDSTGLDWRTAW